MSEERKQILDMLATGKITAEEAGRLLDKLGQAPSGPPVEEITELGELRKLKYLRVHVHSGDGDKVNVHVPLRLIRTGIKLSTVLPSNARKELDEHGVDLNELGKLADEDLMEALRELHVDVDTESGDRVRVFCE